MMMKQNDRIRLEICIYNICFTFVQWKWN